MKGLSSEQIDIVSARARALGDATRVRILLSLSRGEMAVGQIAEATATQQSTVSKHLQVLFHAGLVGRRRSAATVFYRLASPRLLEWLRYLATARAGSAAQGPTAPVRKPNTAARRTARRE